VKKMDKLCKINVHVWKPVRYAGYPIKNLYRCEKCGKEKTHVQVPLPNGPGAYGASFREEEIKEQ